VPCVGLLTGYAMPPLQGDDRRLRMSRSRTHRAPPQHLRPSLAGDPELLRARSGRRGASKLELQKLGRWQHPQSVERYTKIDADRTRRGINKGGEARLAEINRAFPAAAAALPAKGAHQNSCPTKPPPAVRWDHYPGPQTVLRWRRGALHLGSLRRNERIPLRRPQRRVAIETHWCRKSHSAGSF
jgi:hypothetical protein